MKDSIETIVQPYLHNREHLVLTVGVILDNKQHIFTFSKQGDNKQDYLYEIGSITKVFTTSLLAKMIEEQKISLHDPIVKYIPSLSKNKSLQKNPVTIFHLATHTAGLPKVPFRFVLRMLFSKEMFNNPYKYYTPEDMIHFVSNYSFRKVGGKFNYSNLGMGLLGYILCNRLASNYETVIQDQIGEKLNLKNTFATVSEDKVQNLLPGYNRKNERVSNLEFYSLEGAGALKSTIQDQLNFLSSHIGVEKNLQEIFSKTHESYFIDEKGFMVGLGWIIDRDKNILWHNGGTGGYSSFMGFNKEKKIGAVILSNYETSTSKEDSVDFIGAKVLELLDQRGDHHECK